MRQITYSNGLKPNTIRATVKGDKLDGWAEYTHDGTLLRTNPSHPLGTNLTDEELTVAARTVQQLQPAPVHNAYIRFGDLPASGKSRNHATGEDEAGISCYDATWDLINSCYNITGNGLAGAEITYLLQGAPIYLLTGQTVGTGSDGEPVIADATIVGQLTVDGNGYKLN